MTTDKTGIVGLYFAINLKKKNNSNNLYENSMSEVTHMHNHKKGGGGGGGGAEGDLAALPDEVKQIITEAFTLMAARTYTQKKQI
jgi:hypothetical protein